MGPSAIARRLEHSRRRGIFNDREPAKKNRDIRFRNSHCRLYSGDSLTMAAAAGAIVCALQPQKNPGISTTESAIPKLRIGGDSSSDSSRVVLQPRVCTLRAYGSGRDGVIRTRRDVDVSPFLASLSDYVENSRKSQDFETISGRLAMIAFASAVIKELVTGNSLFSKMDLPVIEEAGGACLAAVLCAATSAWFSSARTGVGEIFTVGCNCFVESVIDNLVDGLFYESELSDWTDEI
ncbi:hypothetical protein ACLOJK_016109 [Asimina triloba]